MILNGFEQILMSAIRETVHSDDMDSKTPKVSEEKRFNKAMKAIFGKGYEFQFIENSKFTEQQLVKIYEVKKSGKSLSAAIEHVTPEKLKNNITDVHELKAEKDRLIDMLKKHFARHKKYYEDYTPMEGTKGLEMSEYSEYLKDVKEDRENIFKALRKAGWNI